VKELERELKVLVAKRRVLYGWLHPGSKVSWVPERCRGVSIGSA
jgi:hypothetical protein